MADATRRRWIARVFFRSWVALVIAFALAGIPITRNIYSNHIDNYRRWMIDEELNWVSPALGVLSKDSEASKKYGLAKKSPLGLLVLLKATTLQSGEVEVAKKLLEIDEKLKSQANEWYWANVAKYYSFWLSASIAALLLGCGSILLFRWIFLH